MSPGGEQVVNRECLFCRPLRTQQTRDEMSSDRESQKRLYESVLIKMIKESEQSVFSITYIRLRSRHINHFLQYPSPSRLRPYALLPQKAHLYMTCSRNQGTRTARDLCGERRCKIPIIQQFNAYIHSLCDKIAVAKVSCPATFAHAGDSGWNPYGECYAYAMS